MNAIYNFCNQSHSILKKVRVVLPIDITREFQTELRSGQWTVTKPLFDSSSLDCSQAASTSALSLWLWQDDDGNYKFYRSEEMKFLTQKYETDSSCHLVIGKFKYIIDFPSMTQLNTRTNKSRKIKCVTNEYVWLFKTGKKWKRYSRLDSLVIEAKYLTTSHPTLKMDGNVFDFNFSDMVKVNKATDAKTDIKRMPAKEIQSSDRTPSCHPMKSRVLIFGLPTDIKKAEEELNKCIEQLITTKSIDIHHRIVSALDKHIKQIKGDHRVKISENLSGSRAKYDITGYKECVRGAVTAIYQVLSTTTGTPVQQLSVKPEEWEPQANPIELKNVTEGSLEWNKILKRVKETMLNVELVSIQRIQNEFLWEKYSQHKERMSYKGSASVNEMTLYHGSSSTAPEEIYRSEEGFDMRFSHQGMWGRGNYFAKDARYSCSYAYEISDSKGLITSQGKVKQIFLAMVLTGDSCVSSPDKSLRIPPYKPSTSSEKIRYDTMNGVSAGSRIYVTYSNDKAYPLYLISFVTVCKA